MVRVRRKTSQNRQGEGQVLGQYRGSDPGRVLGERPSPDAVQHRERPGDVHRRGQAQDGGRLPPRPS